MDVLDQRRHGGDFGIMYSKIMKRFNTTIDTDARDNADCDRCRNSEVRHTDADGLCKKVRSVVDGLPVRCVGGWANDKIYYLLQYFQIFAKGMAKKYDPVGQQEFDFVA